MAPLLSTSSLNTACTMKYVATCRPIFTTAMSACMQNKILQVVAVILETVCGQIGNETFPQLFSASRVDLWCVGDVDAEF